MKSIVLHTTLFLNKHVLLSLVSLVFGNVYTYAQDFKTDIKSLYSTMLENKDMSTNVTIYVSGTPMGDLKKYAQIRKSGVSFYYRLDDVEMLLTDKTYLMVDNHNKTIICRPITKKESQQLKKKMVKTDLDSMIQRYDSVVYKGMVNEQKHYVIYVSKQVIQQADIYLSASTGFLTQVSFVYNPKFKVTAGEVVIMYSPLETSSQSNNPCLKERTYLIREGKTWKPGQKYKNYQIKALAS
ncbi:MAG: hypothetical protein K2Q22_08560 [Cytophagales bacterium]|nr:hypothetical protein [Cytophagales bacterium]